MDSALCETNDINYMVAGGNVKLLIDSQFYYLLSDSPLYEVVDITNMIMEI